MKRYWMRWVGGDNGDPRPLTYPVPIEWWCTGESLDDGPNCTICAIVDAEDENAARARVLEFWPEAKWSFCNECEPGWRPNPGRFPPKLAPPGAAEGDPR